MIRDRLVVGLRDSKLSEKLQLDPELILEKVVTQVRQAETVKEQQPLLQGEPHKKPTEAPIGALLKNKKTIGSSTQTKGHQMSEQRQQKATGQGGKCSYCGKSPHNCKKYMAREAICRRCGKKGYF